MRIVKATVEKIEDFQKEDMKDALKLMGFDYLEMNFYRRVELDGDLVLYAELYDDAVLVTVYDHNKEVESKQFSAAIRFINFVEDIFKRYDIEYIRIVDPDDMIVADNGIMVSATTILAKGFNRHDTSTRNKTTTKDFAKQLKQVESSNIWAYAFQPKDEQVGDMLVQFKGKLANGGRGGPGDIYIYYNVPNKIWHRFYLADSKGAFFWKHIRNNIKIRYSKLTGDKRTKLAHGI